MTLPYSIVDLVDNHLVKQSLDSTRDYTYFHASEWSGCHRKIVYAYYEAKGYITVDPSSCRSDPRLERIFGCGHGMHHRWREYLQFMGILRGKWRCMNWMAHKEDMIFGTEEKLGCLKPKQCSCGSDRFEYVEVGFRDDATLWGGHVDTILDLRSLAKAGTNGSHVEDSQTIVDFKTMNTFGFKKLDGPTADHIIQMQIYLYLSGLKEGRFLYEDKNDQNVKEFVVSRNETLIQAKVKEAKRLKYITEHTNSQGKRPLPIRAFTSRTNPVCLSCKFRGDCWKSTSLE